MLLSQCPIFKPLDFVAQDRVGQISFQGEYLSQVAPVTLSQAWMTEKVNFVVI